MKNSKQIKRSFNHEAHEAHREKPLKALPSCSTCASWLKTLPKSTNQNHD